MLKAADLIRFERRGQQIVYSLNTSVFEDVAAVLFDLFRVDGSDGKSARGGRAKKDKGKKP